MKNILFILSALILVACKTLLSPSPVIVGGRTMAVEEITNRVDLTLTVQTKYDNEVDIEYTLQYWGSRNFNDPLDSLNQLINKAIIDSLHRFEMYEMYSSQRASMDTVLGTIYKNHYPRTKDVYLYDVLVPEGILEEFTVYEETKQNFVESLFEIIKRRKVLRQKLESNEELSESEIKEIEKEIFDLGEKSKNIKKKMNIKQPEY